MKAKVTIWYHYFDMSEMKPVNKSEQVNIDVKFSEKLNKELLEVAIVGDKSYEEVFKQNAFKSEMSWLSNDAMNVIKSIVDQLRDEAKRNACKIGVEFNGIDDSCFIIRDFFGSNRFKFVDKSELDYCIKSKESEQPL